MALTKIEWAKLEEKSNQLRELCLDTTYWAGSGHIGGGMSVIDILTVLYYRHLNFDPKNPKDDDRDRFVMSKGHVGIALAPLFADLGLIEKEQLKTFNLTDSKLGIHLDCNKVPGLDASTGSLGHGSSLALGMALSATVRGKNYKSYVVLGDGECNEGSVWEAAMATAHFKAKNLITIVDRNKCMIDGRTEDVMSLEPFADKWRAFGFEVIECDGHDFKALDDAIEMAKKAKDKPYCIICNTIKGCGVDFMEDNYIWHYGAIDESKYNISKASLAKYFKSRMSKVNKEG